MSQALFLEAKSSADALQRVLKAAETHQIETVLNGPDYQLLGPSMRMMVQNQLAQKAIPLQPLSGRSSWWPLTMVRDPFPGAWQRNQEIAYETALSFGAVFSCTTLIMTDVGKLALRLVELDATDNIWQPIENPAYSPVLRKPNRYQNITQFLETWMASKLNTGNTYVLKVRDARTVVKALYVLDPSLVTPLQAEDGSVYYELKRDFLNGLTQERISVPAGEIIHDRMNTLFHPLVGLSPIYACALATTQGLSIQGNSSKLFANGSIPGGVLTAPGAIGDDTAARLKEYWDTNFTGDNVGKVAVLGDGLEYKGMAWNAVDLQLIEQLKWTGEMVCTCYHVPPYLIDIGPPPPYANVEPVIQKYLAQCLHGHLNQIEKCLDEGLGLGPDFGNPYGTEFDPDDLIWLDNAAKSKAAQDGINSGMALNEARQRFYGLGSVTGGEEPFLQHQMWPVSVLANRTLTDLQPPKPQAAPAPRAEEAEEDEDMDMAASLGSLVLKGLELNA